LAGTVDELVSAFQLHLCPRTLSTLVECVARTQKSAQQLIWWKSVSAFTRSSQTRGGSDVRRR